MSVAASPQSSPRLMSAPGCSPNTLYTDKTNPISIELQANSRTRSIRQHSEDPSPEKLIMERGNSFEDYINVEDNGSIDIIEYRGDELEPNNYRETLEKKPKLSITSQFAASTLSSSSSRGFKAPISIQAKRKASFINTSASSFTSGLTDDLTDLQLIKRKKGKMEEDVLCEQAKDQILGSSSSSTKSSSTSSEEDQGPGQGYSTPVPLSAIPRHLKGLKTVKFVSPAGVTPVQHHLSQPIAPLSLAQFDRLDRSFPSSSQSFQSPLPSTPFRTPKSVGRRGSTVQGQSASRLLGTPDYLAPELLLSKGHSMAVDWWALGVCLYEFLVGIPPFTDSTPDAVFDNILSRRLEWPEGEESLSNVAVSAILALLEVNPADRADGPTVRAMPLTKDVNWDNILNMQAPFIPNPDHASDTTYFDARNSMQGLMVSAVDL